MTHYEISELTKDTIPSNSGEFTLYVNNLPGELNEHGLLEIFNHYGYIKGHFHRPNASWAFITYNTYREAENAIKDLHDIPPLRLKVSFAKEKTSNEIQCTKASTFKEVTKLHDNESVKDIKFANKPLIQTKGRGKLLDVFKKMEPNLGSSICTYTTDNDLLYPYPSDPFTYNPYEETEPYTSTNALWTRGQLTITQDGKRHVSLGRGYTKYEIPNPKFEIQNHINKVHEKRASGLYEYGEDMLQNVIGMCKKCYKRTKFTCERCHTFYCSKNCQTVDWPQHKVECQTIPALVTKVHSTAISQSNNEEQTPTRNVSNIQIPLRRPKKLMNTITSSNGANTASKDQDINNITETSFINSTNNTESEDLHTKTNGQNDAYKKNETKDKIPAFTYNRTNFHSKQVDTNQLEVNTEHMQSTKIEEQNCSPLFRKLVEKNSSIKNSEKLDNLEKNTKKLQSFNMDDVNKIEENIAFSKYTFLSKSKFTDVRIIVKLGHEYWVQKVENDNDLIQLMTDLQNEVRKVQKVKPIVGNIYAVEYESVWHRALVTSLNPLKVHYIDYGNDEIVETNDFREINKYKNVPRFCVKIRLSKKANEKYKNIKYEDVITVKMISVDSNKVINVEVQGENDIVTSEVISTNNTSIMDASNTVEVKDKMLVSPITPTIDKITRPLDKLKSIVNTVSVEEKGILEIHAELSNNIYSITLLPNSAISDYEKLLDDLPTKCIQMAENSNHRPCVEDLICGQRLDGDWLRGYILSLESPLKMAIIDEARMMVIGKTVPCPENFQNICAFGATCEITGAKYKFNEGDQYEFMVVTQKTDKKQNEIEIEITKEQDKIKAIVKPWAPMPEQKGLKYAELKSGSEVCLTAYRSHTLLFARSLNITDLEHYNHIMQNVAKCAQTSPFLKELPVVGQMVIAQYIDDNYYRAIVTKVQDDKIAISYVDFGNKEITNIKKLKVLSDDLKQLRSCTAKIVLKDVPQDVPMTKEVSDYLSSLVGTEVPLTCTFDGIPSQDGVYLKLHSGTNVNTIISELLVPTSKEKAEEDKTCYMMNDISVLSLGYVGQTVEAVVLHPIDSGYTYAVCPFDSDLITHIFDIMPKLITAYCKASDYYIPRENELCLALYEGEWYRATCICRSETPTTSSVFFIDFGNIESVNHTDIRLMPKDFITPDALASICEIINVAPTDSNGRYSSEIEDRISKIFVPFTCVTLKIVECDEEAGIYKVELPIVRSTLIDDGLLTN